MTTETSKHPIPGISQEALVRAAALAESYTRVGRFYNGKDVEMVRLRFVEAKLCFQAASPSFVVAAMIDALLDKEMKIWDLQSQIDALRIVGIDNE